MPFGPEFVREISDGGFERGLDRAHHVVVFNHLLGTEIAERDQAAALRHQGFGQAGDGDERMDRDGHGLGEAPCGTIGQPAAQVLWSGLSHGVQHEVETPPGIADRGEDGFEFACASDVARQENRRIDSVCQRSDVRSGAFADKGDGQVRPSLSKMQGTGPGETAFVGDANDQTLAARKVEQFVRIAAVFEPGFG